MQTYEKIEAYYRMKEKGIDPNPTCMWCKISFVAEPWAAVGQPKHHCMNCKNRGDRYREEQAEAAQQAGRPSYK